MELKTNKIFQWLRWIAEHVFFASLVLIFISLLIGGFMFYKYNILVKQAEPETKEAPFQFKKNIYQNILTQWQDREAIFEAAQTKEYPNPFQPE